MEKLLLLGGSEQQVIAIKTAHKYGFYTILCDYLENNPGQYVADKFYLVSTTDKEAVLKVAIKEEINGIIAYASDPAAPTAAYIAERLNLPTNPYESVETLCNKDKFRLFLKSNGFNAPVSKAYNNSKVDISLFSLPVIIKPVDSSGSKGVTVLYNWEGLENALEYAFKYSRAHRIIVEEYIEKKHKYLVGGDLFLNKGKIVLWGLLNCHRDSYVNPLVPVGKSFPLQLNSQDKLKIRETLTDLVDKLGLEFGSINVELIIDNNGKVWLIDIGPRAGGNMIPDLLGLIYGINVIEMAVLAAMGKDVNEIVNDGIVFYATHNLHSNISGKYRTIEFSSELEGKIVKKCLYKKKGDRIDYFDDASKALGIIFMKFKNQEEMDYILDNINDFYKVVIE